MNAQTEMHHSNQHSAEQLCWCRQQLAMSCWQTAKPANGVAAEAVPCDMLRYSTLQLELMFLLEDAVSPSLLQCAEGHKQGGPPER